MRIPEGSGVTLTCQHDKAPKLADFKWTYRPNDFSPSVEAGRKESLTKKQIRKNEEGVYECVMEGYVGDDRVRISRTYNVSVGEPFF